MLTRLTIVLGLLAIACGITSSTALATAPPVGALPAGPTAKVHMKKGQIVTISLPHGVHGRVWRIKGSVNGKILREVSERDHGSKLEVTFKAVGKGMTVVRFGLTRGETARAFLGRRYAVRVR